MYNESTPSKRLPTAIAVAAAALLALPASGLAAETFGSRFANSPNSGACSGLMSAPCTYVSFIHPSDPDGDPYAGGAPKDGVITKFRISAYGAGGPGTPATVTFRLADITRNTDDSAQAKAVATGPTVTIAGSGAIEEFPARVPLRQGNHLGIDTGDANAVYASSGSDFTYVYAPPLVDGAAIRTSDMVTEELLVGAVYEPDADKDGFGDETQDRCLGQAGGDDGCDRTEPVLTALAVTPKAGKGARKLRFRLSEAARVTVRVERVAKGRRVGGKCRKQTAANRDRRACKRYVKRGRIVRDGSAGLNKATMPAKIGGRKLSPGRYRLVATARDKAGNVSAVKRTGFRVKR